MVSILHLFDRHFHLPYACCSLLIICIAISGGQRWYRRRRLSRLRGCLAGRTYPHLDPYIGLGLVRRVVDAYNAKRVLQLWQDLQTEIGHTFHFWVFGERNLVTDEPENVKAILSTEFASFDHGPNRHHAYAPLLGDGIFAVDGARWRDSRALLRPNFAKSQICDVDLFERHFGNFLRALPANNVPVDLQEMFKRLSMDIITEMLFGSSTGTLTRKDGDDLNAFSSGCEYSQKVVWRKIAFGWKAKLWPDSKDRRSRQILHDTVDQYVQQWVPQEQRRSDKKKRAGSDQSRYVFLEHLAERTQDPKVLRDQLLSTLLGGRDTTSTLLSNLFWILARSPSMWCKLREEANSPDLQLLNRESLKKASFARQCLQESLRHRPVVPINQRWANKDIVLPRGGGLVGDSPLLVPQGSNMFINVWAMHKRKDIWGEDAEEFRPERWENLHPGWEYVPFGGGPRICIAQELALSEATYILIRMLQCFENILPTDDEPWRENLSITLTASSGCKVWLRRASVETLAKENVGT